MKQKAEKFLNTALGGNMNLATLKPLALIEIMTAFAEIEVAAINYTHSSTQLKDKKTMTFTEWIESNKGYIINGDVFNEHDYQQNRNELVKRYNKIHNL